MYNVLPIINLFALGLYKLLNHSNNKYCIFMAFCVYFNEFTDVKNRDA